MTSRRARDPRGPPQGTADMILDLGGGTCLWQGGKGVAEDLARLRNMEIGAVVNCTHNLHFPGWCRVGGPPIKVARFVVSGGLLRPLLAASAAPAAASGRRPILDYFKTLYNEVDAAKGRGTSLLVHCNAGAHRAGLSMCAVVMRECFLTPRGAVNHVRSKRAVTQVTGDNYSTLVALWEEMQSSAAPAAPGRLVAVPLLLRPPTDQVQPPPAPTTPQPAAPAAAPASAPAAAPAAPGPPPTDQVQLPPIPTTPQPAAPAAAPASAPAAAPASAPASAPAAAPAAPAAPPSAPEHTNRKLQDTNRTLIGH